MATVLVAGVVLASAAQPAGAEEGKAPVTVRHSKQAAFSTAAGPPGRQVESVLTDPRGAMTATKGNGWLLHSGKRHDTCERSDATSGLRMMCLAW